MENMKKIQMEVIAEPEPGTASVLVLAKKGPYTIIRGAGDTDYVCGACRNVICERVGRGQILNMVFRCPQCGSFNVVRGT